MKNPLLWLTCPSCCTATANAIFTRAGQHIKARCPNCGSHIQFVSKSLFKTRELDQLREEKELLEIDANRKGIQYDLFK